MPLAREQRKLATILAADRVGYSRLVEQNVLALFRFCATIMLTTAQWSADLDRQHSV